MELTDQVQDEHYQQFVSTENQSLLCT